MRALILVAILFFTCKADVFEQNCLPCHQKLDVGIDKFFYRYVLVFSSELSVKAALIDYLRNPMKEKSILPEGLIEKYGIKEPTKLTQKELEEAIDTYWDRYTFIGKIR
jgi:hypothetical protein